MLVKDVEDTGQAGYCRFGECLLLEQCFLGPFAIGDIANDAVCLLEGAIVMVADFPVE